jgi:hypothetical protein
VKEWSSLESVHVDGGSVGSMLEPLHSPRLHDVEADKEDDGDAAAKRGRQLKIRERKARERSAESAARESLQVAPLISNVVVKVTRYVLGSSDGGGSRRRAN